jgi:hypothetical protein
VPAIPKESALVRNAFVEEDLRRVVRRGRFVLGDLNAAVAVQLRRRLVIRTRTKVACELGLRTSVGRDSPSDRSHWD